MDVEIIEKKENPLLERTEVRFKVSFEGATPSRKQVRDKLIALLNSDRNLTVLDSVETNYGSQVAVGYIKVYANEKAMSTEPQYILERNKKADVVEEKAKEEAPAEEEATGKAPEGDGASEDNGEKEADAEPGDDGEAKEEKGDQ